jgi:hypothetical protein
MIPKKCNRLAEVDFPIAEVSRHAAREKSIRHGHPSTLHLWWARRPLASSRASLLCGDERRMANDRRDCYLLYIVTDCDNAPRPGAARLERGDEGGALLLGGERDDEAHAGA